jgi:predicted nucleic-acid-binding Zn-ribbon protein
MFTEERGPVVLLSAAEFSDIQLQSYYLVQCLKAKYV